MLSGGGLMLPHPEAPRFLTLILSANRRFPLGSLAPSSDAVSRGIPAFYFSRPRTLYSIPFNFSTTQLRPSQEPDFFTLSRFRSRLDFRFSTGSFSR